MGNKSHVTIWFFWVKTVKKFFLRPKTFFRSSNVENGP